jgi:hypothetical protein
VSKLCCPLCWDLLGDLQIERFNVRGYHSVLTPVELPGCIDSNMAERLLTVLQRRLITEIGLFLTAKKKSMHRRNDFEQSVGSVASDDSRKNYSEVLLFQ